MSLRTLSRLLCKSWYIEIFVPISLIDNRQTENAWSWLKTLGSYSLSERFNFTWGKITLSVILLNTFGCKKKNPQYIPYKFDIWSINWKSPLLLAASSSQRQTLPRFTLESAAGRWQKIHEWVRWVSWENLKISRLLRGVAKGLAEFYFRWRHATREVNRGNSNYYKFIG